MVESRRMWNSHSCFISEPQKSISTTCRITRNQNPNTLLSNRSPWKYKVGFSHPKNQPGPSPCSCPAAPPPRARTLGWAAHGHRAGSPAAAVNQTLTLPRRSWQGNRVNDAHDQLSICKHKKAPSSETQNSTRLQSEFSVKQQMNTGKKCYKGKILLLQTMSLHEDWNPLIFQQVFCLDTINTALFW